MKEETVYLLLGSNIGNKFKFITDAKHLIHNQIGYITKTSSSYLTEPWGVENQDVYLNQAIEITTSLEPHEVLSKILKFEIQLGRKEPN